MPPRRWRHWSIVVRGPYATRRADQKEPRSAPVTFDVEPATRAALPAARHPDGAHPRAFDIVSADPDVFVAVPAPMAGLPELTLDPFTRQNRDHLHARRRRRFRNVDLGLQLRHRRRSQCGRAGHDGDTAEQATACHILHGMNLL